MSTMKVNRIENTSTASGGLDIDTSGNVRVTTLADSAGNNDSTPAEIASGRAKAWVNFDGTGTVAIRDSFNVSSITDNGAGDYTIAFTNAMANANYAMVGTGSLDARTETIVVTGYTESTRLTGSIRVNTRYDNSIVPNGVNVDVSTVAVAIFGG